MRKHKKLIALVMVAMFLATTLVGCGGAKDTAKQNDKKVDFPTKPMTLIVAYAAGGGTDALARVLADASNKYLPQAIGVVNKTGGAGAIGLNEGAKAKPDGYTMTMIVPEAVYLPFLGRASYSIDDFQPIVRLNADPAAVVVKADAPWNTLDDFLKNAKANPGKVRIGNSGTGGMWHLAAVALADKTGTKYNYVPYDGASSAVTALLGGQLEAVTVSPAEAGNQVEAGQLKMLGIMADQRVEKFKNVPTLKELGIDLSIGTWRGIAVPKNTPKEVVDVLKEAFTKAAKEQAYIDTLKKLGLGIAFADDVEFGKAINKDRDYLKELIDKLGIK